MEGVATVGRALVEQHSASGLLESVHRPVVFLSEASMAPIASATLAATVVIVMNRILVRSSGIKVEF